MTYKDAYKKLNDAQKAAVDTIDGPLLVVAGPGTGKTQLLATRVAHILKLTDTPAQNILCLTFTESAALNMRERLMGLIGNDAYDVKIGTYHSFGSDIIRSYPEYFESINTETSEESRLERPIDELAKHQILLAIADGLPYDNPLKSTRYHVGDLINTISDLKKSLLSPKDLRLLAKQNLDTIALVSPAVNLALAGIATMPSKLDKSRPLFLQIAESLSSIDSALAKLGHSELLDALQLANEQQKSTPLTQWKNSWLHKTASNSWSYTDPKLSRKLHALADVLEAYATQLSARNLYDFDDMIVRAIHALQQNDELRFNLQEKYLYILLDEFQDTNAAQFELVKQLTNNLASEGRPNVMAVGDDDQAIFAFQGAEAGNMIDFIQSYTDVAVINLTQNYRSHSDIIVTAQNVTAQIHTRLHDSIHGVVKTLTASAPAMPKNAQIERLEFVDKPNEYTWIAARINQLITDGESLDTIAILAPRHKYLEAMVPYLNAKEIAVTYEKRENILQAPIVQQLKIMSQLVLALQQGDQTMASYYCAIVLSDPVWQVPVEELWQVNWQATSYDFVAGNSADQKQPWLQVALQNSAIKKWVVFFMTLAGMTAITPLEVMLDYMTGTEPLQVGDTTVTSPLKEHYFSDVVRQTSQQDFFETLTQLSVIREKLRDHQLAQEHTLMLADFTHFFAMYEAADQPLLNTHPVSQSDQSVQLMTTFKAKGLEFSHVFLLSLHDNVWGMSAGGNSNKLSLPPNLKHIRYGGSNEDELLRLFFVAITRAKKGLYLTSHKQAQNGKKVLPLKFLEESPLASGSVSAILPKAHQSVLSKDALPLAEYQQAIELLWHAPHSTITPTLKSLLTERLQHYVMSPTHINTFVDLSFGGPVAFLLNTLLRFPKAPTSDGQFGNAIHETLDWYCKQAVKPTQPALQSYLQMRLKYYFKVEPTYNLLLLRGGQALKAYIAQKGPTIGAHDVSEYDFRSEGVLVSDVHLSGKIDRMIIDKAAKTITVIDYKTGESYTTWKSTIKLLKYRQQLCMYKLLVEGSHTYKGYTVTSGILDFVEPDDEGVCNSLTLEFNDAEIAETRQLISAVWQKIHDLDLPDVAAYPQTYAGVKQFIADLIS